MTFRGEEGKDEVILRADIKALGSLGRSIMPEGLEKDLKPDDFANLLAFLREARARSEIAVRQHVGGRLKSERRPAAFFPKSIFPESESHPIHFPKRLRMPSKPTDVRVIAASLYFLPIKTRVPLKFGPEITTQVTCARVCVTVRNQEGQRRKDGAKLL